ncbi:hypothetical protein ACI780_01255 [Geodermatophilus sp. SYSU D00814]
MSRTRSRRPLRVALALLVVAAAALAVLWWRAGGGAVAADDTPAPSSTASTAPSSTPPSPSSPAPSSAPSSAGGSGTPADGTAPATGTTTAPTPGQGGPAAVAVAVTWSQWDDASGSVLAGGIVGDVVEAGGRCTLTLSRGGVVLTGESEAEPDAATTSCGQVAVSGAGLTAGAWDAVLSYASDRSAGESAPFTVVVP